VKKTVSKFAFQMQPAALQRGRPSRRPWREAAAGLPLLPGTGVMVSVALVVVEEEEEEV
jgi:hypothetical protein